VAVASPEVVHVLQDQEPGDEPRRQARLAWPRRADRSKAPIEKPPIDLARQPCQRVTQIDDLIESALQEILLPLVTRSRHAVRLHTENASARESRSNSKIAKRKKAALKH